MAMIKGKIETEREVVPKRVVSGTSTTFKSSEASWEHIPSGKIIKIRDMDLVTQAFKNLRKKTNR